MQNSYLNSKQCSMYNVRFRQTCGQSTGYADEATSEANNVMRTSVLVLGPFDSQVRSDIFAMFRKQRKRHDRDAHAHIKGNNTKYFYSG